MHTNDSIIDWDDLRDGPEPEPVPTPTPPFAQRPNWERIHPNELFPRYRVGDGAFVIEPDTGCWLWTGTVDKSTGYGVVRRNGRRLLAHRVFYEWWNGPIPEGLELDHVKERCRNKHCVNPTHLEAVTHAINTRRGVRKLSETDVREIRRAYAAGETQMSLARRFHIDRGSIRAVVHRQTFRDES